VRLDGRSGTVGGPDDDDDVGTGVVDGPAGNVELPVDKVLVFDITKHGVSRRIIHLGQMSW
jgi:hypothetical protein